MGQIYTNQVVAGSGFRLTGEYPIDDREIVQTYDDLAVLVKNHFAYEGMRVYVVNDKKSY
jgi:hypothetical protein